jgi:hypothetical protein
MINRIILLISIVFIVLSFNSCCSRTKYKPKKVKKKTKSGESIYDKEFETTIKKRSQKKKSFFSFNRNNSTFEEEDDEGINRLNKDKDYNDGIYYESRGDDKEALRYYKQASGSVKSSYLKDKIEKLERVVAEKKLEKSYNYKNLVRSLRNNKYNSALQKVESISGDSKYNMIFKSQMKMYIFKALKDENSMKKEYEKLKAIK